MWLLVSSTTRRCLSRRSLRLPLTLLPSHAAASLRSSYQSTLSSQPSLPQAQLKASTTDEPKEERLQPSQHRPLRWTKAPEFSIAAYRDLSKARLSALVLLTTMAGCAVAPGAIDPWILLFTTVGTGLCVASANTINQLLEHPYDAQMARTKTRVLVKHALSTHHAFAFGALSGIFGVSTLYVLVNPLVAALGAANILLYTAVYTPMKRISVANTHVGAIVGAIPPMMGFAASTGSLGPGAWIVGAILYSWQFPHFNALSVALRNDYAKAGYRMMVITDPGMNTRVALRHAIFMFPICIAAPWVGLTTPLFIATSSVVNGALLLAAYRFWSNSTDKSARSLFFLTLLHLPVLLILLIIHKARPHGDQIEQV